MLRKYRSILSLRSGVSSRKCQDLGHKTLLNVKMTLERKILGVKRFGKNNCRYLGFNLFSNLKASSTRIVEYLTLYFKLKHKYFQFQERKERNWKLLWIMSVYNMVLYYILCTTPHTPLSYNVFLQIKYRRFFCHLKIRVTIQQILFYDLRISLWNDQLNFISLFYNLRLL